MRLTFDHFDGRGRVRVNVVDQDTGNLVGYIQSNGVGIDKSGGIRISLFEGKYVDELNRYEECVGFVKGVQAVLNHMVRTPPQSKPASKPNAA